MAHFGDIAKTFSFRCIGNAHYTKGKQVQVATGHRLSPTGVVHILGELNKMHINWQIQTIYPGKIRASVGDSDPVIDTTIARAVKRALLNWLEKK